MKQLIANISNGESNLKILDLSLDNMSHIVFKNHTLFLLENVTERQLDHVSILSFLVLNSGYLNRQFD